MCWSKVVDGNKLFTLRNKKNSKIIYNFMDDKFVSKKVSSQKSDILESLVYC